VPGKCGQPARNIAIIAHVDTQDDARGRAAVPERTFRANERVAERRDGHIDLERERASRSWPRNGVHYGTCSSTSSTRPGTRISREVERTLSMVDGCSSSWRSEGRCADALRPAQGPRTRLPRLSSSQDRPPRRAPKEVLNEVYDLFIDSTPRGAGWTSGAYTNARAGTTTPDLDTPGPTSSRCSTRRVARPPPAGDAAAHCRCSWRTGFERLRRPHRRVPDLNGGSARDQVRQQGERRAAADARDQLLTRSTGSSASRWRRPQRATSCAWPGSRHHDRRNDHRRRASDPCRRSPSTNRPCHDLRCEHVADGRQGRPVRHLAPAP